MAEQPTYSYAECPCGVVFVSTNRRKRYCCKACVYRYAHTRPVKHGWSRTRVYNIWIKMVQRCTNPLNPDYDYYGGRGISVCSRWLESLLDFIKDMGEPKIGETLERLDNNGNYEPSNCCWATRADQARNTRNTILLEYSGRIQCMSEWSREFNVPLTTFWRLIHNGNTVEDIALCYGTA
jgi:hypothetical protein